MEATWPLIECAKQDERAGAALRSVQSLRRACERGGWGCSRAGLRDVHHPVPLSRWISDDLRGNPARTSRREGRKKAASHDKCCCPSRSIWQDDGAGTCFPRRSRYSSSAHPAPIRQPSFHANDLSACGNKPGLRTPAFRRRGTSRMPCHRRALATADGSHPRKRRWRRVGASESPSIFPACYSLPEVSPVRSAGRSMSWSIWGATLTSPSPVMV